MINYPFTAVPNWFFQIAKDLKEAELRIMLEVWYQTAGKQRAENVLSYNFIGQQTGLKGTSSISSALKSLESRQLITRKAKRINGQGIQVSPTIDPCLPVHILIQKESQTPLKGVTDSSKRSHNKNDSESMIQETTTGPALEESLGEIESLLLSWGIDSTTISKHIPKMGELGQDIEYLRALEGYVAELKPKNRVGYLVSALTRNWPRKSMEPVAAPKAPKGGLDLSKYEHGGSSHFLAKDTCPICHPELTSLEEQS